MENRFNELLDVFESDASNRSLDITGKRRDTVIEALRIAATNLLPSIEHATDNEKRIVARLVTDILATSGCSLSVNDGEEISVVRSTDDNEIYAALGSTGEDYLIVHQTGLRDRWVRLIWGNDVDVISDYHVSLETIMKGANEIANRLDGR